MFTLDASTAATLILNSVPGLWTRVEGALQSICEAAVELRSLRGKSFVLDDRFMHVRVGEFLVSYILDLEIPRACVMRVEPAIAVEEVEPDRGRWP